MKLRKFMKISKSSLKNNNADYSVLVGLGAIKFLKKQIALVCPNTKKVALIFDKKIPSKLKKKIKNKLKIMNSYILSIFC